jgi:hypothetical protein
VRQRFSGFMHGKSKDVLRLEASVALDAKLAEVFDGNKAMMDAVRDEIEHYAQQIFQSKQMIKAEDRVIRTGEELNKLSIGMLEHFIAMKKIRAELSSLTTDTRLSASFVPPTIEEDGLFSKQSVFDMDALRESYGSEMSVVNIADRIVAAEAALGSTKADKAEGYRSVLGPFRRVVKDAREQVAVIYAKYNGGVPVSTLEVRDDFALTAIASPPPSESTPSQDDIAQRVRAILAPVGDDQSKPFDPDV